MNAIIINKYGTSDDLVFEKTPIPTVAEDQLLVKIYASAVNHIDYLKASGALKTFYPLTFPWIPGRDFAGIVEKVGKKVEQYKKGDQVYGDSIQGGVYAEYAVVAPENVSKLPGNLSFIQAASVPVAALTAWQAFFKHSQLTNGQRVLIHGGAGAVGAYGVQIAKHVGAKVITTASSKDVHFLHALGADLVIDYQKEDFGNRVKDMDIVLDLVGGDVQQRSYNVLKIGGTLIATNQNPDTVQANKFKVKALMMHQTPSSDDLQDITRLLENNILKPFISKIYPLEAASQAWKQLSQNGTPPLNKQGKIVLQVL